MINLVTAQRHILDRCAGLGPETVAIGDALGQVTAEAVRAEEHVPAFANSAMDGYALRADDTAGAPVTLRVVGTTMAGMAPISLGPGEAVRLMTGAALPDGADAVCMQERTTPGAAESEVVVCETVAHGTFVRRPGDDVRAGQEVFDAGTTLQPAHLGVLASLGRTSVRVVRRPRVGVLSTGDELLDASAPLAPGRIRDANRPSLTALLQRAGCTSVDLGAVPDVDGAIEAAVVDGARRCDAVVVSGGVSVGDADLVKVVLDRLCAGTMRWMQIAIKPAKPFAFGTLATGVPVFGVPGNPVSAMVSFELLVRPALRKMAGHRTVGRPHIEAVVDDDLTRPVDGKTHYLRVAAHFDDDGVLHVRSSGTQQSHVLHAMALANALAVLPDGPGARVGERVRVMLLDLDSLGAAAGSGAGA
jgi:molybdenum cofactor synthesis domain-containing protein